MPNFFNLTEYGIIRVSGSDAEKFLQRQLTCDVREVTAQQSRLGAHCDPKGRIQFCFRLFKYHDNYYLRILKSLIEPALTLLQKYAVFSKVKLEDISTEWFVFGLNELPTFDFLAAMTIDETKENQNKIFIRVPGQTPRFEVIGAITEMDNLQKMNFEQWRLLDIRAGIPTIFPETRGQFTPHDINYPQINGVSFNKGCYTGQEIIARMHFLGKLKQHLYHVQFMTNTAPAIGANLVDEAEHIVGTLIESAAVSNQHYEALAVLQDKALAKPILIENSTKTILQVLDLPYTL